MSLTAIIALLLTYVLIGLIKATDMIAPVWKAIPPVTLIVSYVSARVGFLYYPLDNVDSLSLLMMVAITVVITILLINGYPIISV